MKFIGAHIFDYDATFRSNIGIGTFNPSNKLQIESTNNNDGFRLNYPSNNSTQYPFFIGKSDDSVYFRVNSSNLAFKRNGGTSTIKTEGSSNDLTIQSQRHLIFNTSDANERARITNDGKLGLGVSSPDVQFHASGDVKFTNAFVLDSIKHSGDSDTKISFDTDTIKFDTGGTERVRILNDGKVGIGTTSPEFKTHIYSNDTSTRQFMIDQDSTGDAVMAFRLTGISEYVIGIDNSDSDKFKIANSATVGTTTRLTIDGTGNVGIGTSSPSRPLHVKNTSSQTVAVFDGGNNNAGEIGFVGNGTSGDTYVTIGAVGNDMSFSAGASERVRISNNGRVGVGTSSPNAALDIQGSAADLRLTSTGQNRTALANTSTGFEISQIGNKAIYFLTNGTEKARITGDGKVGVGTNSPAQLLHVYGSSNATAQIEGNSGLATMRLISGSYTTGYDMLLDTGGTAYLFNRNNGNLSFGTNNSEKMRLTSGGTLGISTTSPDSNYKLDVNGKAQVRSVLELDDVLTLNAISTPADPGTNQSSIYMDSADGAIRVKINVGGTTVTRTLATFE